MSLKTKKHILFVLAILMMLMIIPTSFAEDVNDVAIGDDSADVVIQASDDDNNVTAISDGGADVLAAGTDYVSSPSPREITHVIGESDTINVIVQYTTEEEDYWSGYNLEGDYMYAYINGVGVELDDIDSESKSFSVDLKDLDDNFVAGNTYSIVFHPSNGFLSYCNLDTSDCTFYATTVTVTDGSSSDEDDNSNVIWVDASVSGTGSGTETNPYKKIEDVLTSVNGQSGTFIIKVKEGTYTPTTYYQNQANVSIIGVGNVVFSQPTTPSSGSYLWYNYGGSKPGYYMSFKNIIFDNIKNSYIIYSRLGGLTMENCTIRNTQTSMAMVYNYGSNLNITNCIFTDNICTGTNTGYGGIIGNYYTETYNGAANINYNIFKDNTLSTMKITKYSIWGTVNIDYNYWGSNNAPVGGTAAASLADYRSGYGIIVDNYVKINGSIVTPVTVGDTKDFTLKFTDKNGNNLTQNLPDYTVFLSGQIDNAISSSVTITSNKGVATYAASNSGEEIITIAQGSNILTTVDFEVQDKDDGTVLYVDVVNGNDEYNGNVTYPFKTITKALNSVTSTIKSIIIKEGNYTINGLITSDLDIIGKGNVYIGTSTTHLTINNANVNLTNLKFVNATAKSIVTTDNLNINNCVFKDNSGEYVIESSGTVNISNSAFVSNSVNNIVKATNGDVSGNFWGSNDAPNVSGVTYTNYVIISTDLSDELISGDTAFNVNFVANSGSLAGTIPDVDVNLTAANGTVSPTTVTISGNAGSAKYTSADGKLADEVVISIGSEDILSKDITISEVEEGVYYVAASGGSDSNNGQTKNTPFADIKTALNKNDVTEIRLLEGTFDIASAISLSKNVNITGVGDVIITTSANTAFTQSGSCTVYIKNITFNQCYYTGGTAVYASSGSSSKTVYFIECNFIKNIGYNIIYGNYLNINIIRCNFLENTASSTTRGSAGIICEYNPGGSTLAISYSNFIGNVVNYDGNYLIVDDNNGNKATITANNNYWGTNDEPTNIYNYPTNKFTMDNYIIITGAAPESDIYATYNIDLTVKFADDSGNDLTSNMAKLPVTLTASNGGVITPESINISKENAVSYVNNNEGDETVHIKYGTIELASFTFTVGENPEGRIFVSKAGNDADGNGSVKNPYASIARALEDNYDDKIISVQSGTFELANANIDKNVTIVGKDDTVIDLMGTSLTSTAPLTLSNIAIINGTAISTADLTANKVLFTNFTGTNVITSTGSVDISYSAFVNNAASNIVNANSGNVSNNFWGSNNAPNVNNGLTLENYVIVNLAIPNIRNDELSSETNHDVNVIFKSNDTGDLAGKLPDVDVEISAANGTVASSTVTISENTGTTSYKYDVEGATDEVSVKLNQNTLSSVAFTLTENENGRIYVNGLVATSGDGSKANPYKTINEALTRNYELGGGYEVIVYEGSYTITSYTISAPVNITGRGEVNVTTSSTNYLFSTAYALSLNNLIIQNCRCTYSYGTNGIVIYVHGSSSSTIPYLSINNCTFRNNTAYYSIVYAFYTTNVNITNSTFENNVINSYYLIYNGGTSSNVTMLHNNFIENTLKGNYPLIYLMYGNRKINYNNFVDNTAASMIRISSGNIDANYNYWGTNDNPSSKLDSTVSISNWVILNSTIDVTKFISGNEYDVDFEFIVTTGSSNSTLNESMPEITFDTTAILNKFDSSIEMMDNKGSIVYSALKDGNEIITLSYNGNDVAAFAFKVIEDSEGKIFVSKDGDDTDGDGSIDNPYATISRALKDDYEGKTISVQSGTFELANADINKNVTLLGKDDTVIDLMGTSITGSATLTLNNIAIINGTDAIVSAGDIIANKVLFINNTGENVVKTGGNVNISDSVFISNDVSANIVDAKSGNVSNNFWGSNDKPNVGDLTLENWIVIVPELNSEYVYADYETLINIYLKSTGDGETFDEPDAVLPEFEISIIPVNGTSNPASIVISENIGNVSYITDIEGTDKVNFNIGDDTVVSLEFNVYESMKDKIFVAVDGDDVNGDGTLYSPLATIQKAMDLNYERGGSQEIILLEGTHTISSKIYITGDVTITSRGKVYITSDYYGLLFDTSGSSYGDLTLINVTVENVTSTSYAAVIYASGSSSDRKTIKFINCTFNNLQGPAAVVQANSYVDLTIVGCNFTNNYATSSGMVYSNGASNTNRNMLNITNSTFMNNRGPTIVSVYYYTNAFITYSKFINNNATGNSNSYQGLISLYSYNSLEMHYNHIINTKISSTIMIYAYGSSWSATNTGNLNYNYWGVNTYQPTISSYFTRSYSVILTPTIIPSTVDEVKDYSINLVFKSSNGNDLTDSMPDLPIDITAVLGEVNPISVVMSNNVSETTYRPLSTGSETVSLYAYGTKLADLTFTVDLIGTKVNLDSSENITYGDPFTVGVNVENATTGEVILYINGDENQTKQLESGSTSFELSGLYTGEYNITVKYAGEGNIAPSIANTTLTVIGLDPELDIDVSDIEIGDNLTVKVTLPEDAEGTVTVLVDGLEVLSQDVGDEYEIELDLALGKYNITVVYSGDKKYKPVSVNKTFNITKRASYVIGEDLDVVYGDEIVIEISVPVEATGIVTVLVNSTSYTINLTNGENSTAVNPLDAGTYTVEFSYEGDDNYFGCENTITITVTKTDAIIKINIDENVAINETATLTVTLTENATGNITVYVNGKATRFNAEDGTVSMDIDASKLSEGEQNIIVVYSGDENFRPSDESASFNIYKFNTPIASGDVEINVGEKAVIEINLLDDVTGLVLVEINGEGSFATVNKGKASVSISDLANGTYTATITYHGDGKYNSNSTEIIIKVFKSTDYEMDVNIPEAEADQKFTIDVELPSDAAGNVTVTIGNETYTVPVKDGKASVAIDALDAGNYTAEVTYSGDDKYEGTSASEEFTVSKVANPEIDISVLGSVKAGEETTVSVSVPEDASGNVSVTVDGKTYTAPVKDGVANVIVPALSSGSHTAVVAYSGDDKYDSAYSVTTINVDKVNPVINATCDEIEEGEKATIVINLPDDATGVVLASVDGTTYGALIRDGKATLTVPGLAAGTYTANITYPGDSRYNSGSASANVVVNQKEPEFVITAPDVSKFYSGSERLEVTVTKDGKAAAGQQVNITINGNTYARTTDDKGQTSIALNLNSGNYTATVSAGDVSVNASVVIKSTVYGKDITKVYRNATQYHATFYDANGNVLKNTMVSFNINGVFYNRTTDDKGEAGLNINLNPDTYIITAINPVTGERYTNTVTVVSHFIEHHDLVKVYRNASQYVIKISDDQGNVAGAGEVVTFNINGVFYNRTSDVNGNVQMNINLQPGEYIITADYKGERISDKITVLSA